MTIEIEPLDGSSFMAAVRDSNVVRTTLTSEERSLKWMSAGRGRNAYGIL
jgi:hypothetical protein